MELVKTNLAAFKSQKERDQAASEILKEERSEYFLKELKEALEQGDGVILLIKHKKGLGLLKTMDNSDAAMLMTLAQNTLVNETVGDWFYSKD